MFIVIAIIASIVFLMFDIKKEGLYLSGTSVSIVIMILFVGIFGALFTIPWRSSQPEVFISFQPQYDYTMSLSEEEKEKFQLIVDAGGQPHFAQVKRERKTFQNIWCWPLHFTPAETTYWKVVAKPPIPFKTEEVYSTN